MAKRGKIDGLPPDVRRWLERALTENGFGGYVELEALLEEQGYHISKSAIHRYGQKISRRFAAIRASTEAARILTEGAPDDADARSEALMALVQTELFERIVEFQEAEEGGMTPLMRIGVMSTAAKNIATLTRSSVTLKKFQVEVRARVAAAADAVARIAVKGGLSDAAAAEIRGKILGIAN